MKSAKRLGRTLKRARKSLRGARKKAKGIRKSALAGAAGVALLFSNLGGSLKDKASDFKENGFSKKKKSREVIEVKKSTVVALLVALAAVAGVLCALYFYVIRREKELDEYEELLFSEDFGDDELPEGEEAAAPAEA